MPFNRPLSGGCEMTGVIRGGVFLVDDKRTLARRIAALKDGPYTLHIEPAGEARSLAINRFYWGIVIPAILATGRFKTEDEVHTHYKETFHIASTTKLEERRFRLYLDQVMSDAAIEHGAEFPEPEPLVGVA